MEESRTAHIAMIPSVGMGHIIPFIELSKRIIELENSKFSVTLIIPCNAPLTQSQKLFLSTLPDRISHIALPPVNLDDLDEEFVGAEARVCETITRSITKVQEVVSTLVKTKRLVAFVTDVFGTDAFDIAEEFNVSKYVFFTSAALSFSVMLHLAELDKNIPCEFKDWPEPIKLPGCIPLKGEDLLDPVQDKKKDDYKWFIFHGSRYKLADGVIINTFQDLEPGPIGALVENGNPKIYPIGPLTQMQSILGNKSGEESECKKWLNDQPNDSVLYVSFGSGGTLSSKQFQELAIGLEQSGQRFIWVVRMPNDKAANAAYFNSETEDSLGFLPDGFLARTKARGLVIRDWAPQAEILSHGSTGGYLTHCGWNSILEAVTCGIPLIVWPLYAEQRTNAVLLTEELKVALRPKESEDGVIGRDEIANVVKSLMDGEEGKEFSKRMKELMVGGQKALSSDGSSTKSLAELASIWTSMMLSS
ncbi:hypothetical protein Leryth_019387 [Lithospermum erythrorhizon]|nr:hypothetical protein Leryth_019387 [Lithospermum erythrorhizon]